MGLTCLLVDHGADATVKDKIDKDGSTPLYSAMKDGLIDLTRGLVGHWVDVIDPGHDWATPLKLAL